MGLPTAYMATDTETTGASDGMRRPSNMIMLSMVYENPAVTKDIPVWELPCFTAIVAHDVYVGEAYALGMNGWIFKMIGEHERGNKTKYPVVTLSTLVTRGTEWAYKVTGGKKPQLLGQNFGSFDSRFIPQELLKMFHYRVLEIGSFFADPLCGAKSLAEVKKECGFGDHISHNAWHESMDYILCMRTKYGGNVTMYDPNL